ncbi:uncharacterized protein LOC127642200 [Xyrauchen texanus]|uniref:uncharacterized protein LOC127642200 n=1 Tax=Xyrauchen texanus TaxID=154827 RepID=UPI0022428EBF|nr:uncharacterized protein LOC127642200 [Xyrauchen texanus]
MLPLTATSQQLSRSRPVQIIYFYSKVTKRRKKRRSYKTWLIPDIVEENISIDDSGDNISKSNRNSPDAHGNVSTDDENEVISDADGNFSDADESFSADDEDDVFSTAYENFPQTHIVRNHSAVCEGSTEEREEWCASEEKIYPNAKITNEESLLSILAYSLRHTTSKVALSDLLDLINLHCPDSTNGVPDSLYKFMKSFHCDTFEVQYICPSCQYFFGNEIPTHCASCNGAPGDMENLIKSGSVFIKLSIADQLRGKFQNTDFCQSLNYKWSRTKRNSQNVEDIFDGTMYKSIDALNDPNLAEYFSVMEC